ncbi:SAV_915 family protein [Streptomyces mobaraensis]|uniref:SAV_915 family protein n=1 Tax=Streptomyces mobaraensis TaxID=35621 RepID=UPI0013DFC378|nr:SAV_915 family protein [Streptomyces mobaraensis]
MSTTTLADEDIVLAPAHPRRADGHEVAEDAIAFETRRSATGEVCGLAFTSAEALVSCLGPEQRWVAVPLGTLRNVLGAAGIATLALDPYALPSRAEGRPLHG